MNVALFRTIYEDLVSQNDEWKVFACIQWVEQVLGNVVGKIAINREITKEGREAFAQQVESGTIIKN